MYGIVDVRRESVQTGWATSVTRAPLSPPLSLSVDQLRNPTPPTDNASPGFPHLAIGDMLLPDLRRGTKHAMLQYADTRLCCYYCSTAAASFGTFLQTGVLHVQHDDMSALVFMTQEERMGRGLEWLYLWSAS